MSGRGAGGRGGGGYTTAETGASSDGWVCCVTPNGVWSESVRLGRGRGIPKCWERGGEEEGSVNFVMGIHVYANTYI